MRAARNMYEVDVDQGSAIPLIEELSAKLLGMAEDLRHRAAAARGTDDGRTASPLPIARRVMEERRLRDRFLPDELFHEPAWDMLLALYVAQHEGRVLNVKTLVAAAGAPVTTSQRWIDQLGKLGLVERVIDPADRRRLEVSLSESGLQALEEYLAAIS